MLHVPIVTGMRQLQPQAGRLHLQGTPLFSLLDTAVGSWYWTKPGRDPIKNCVGESKGVLGPIYGDN